MTRTLGYKLLLLGMISLVQVSAILAQCPAVSISTAQKQYCISDFVELTATGVPQTALVEWNLGAGWDTSEVHHFGAAPLPGDLSLDLRLTLSDGTVCSYFESNLVEIFDLPQVDFDVSRTLLCRVNDTITLIDKTPTSSQRNWVVNGTTYENTELTQVIPISASGLYNVTLFAQDTNGCRNAKVVNSAIKVYDDINLDFVSTNLSNCYPITTNYISSVQLQGQTIESYQWQLNGSSQTLPTSQNVTGVTYSSVGKFDAQLTVKTDQGCAYFRNKPNYIALGDVATLAVKTTATSACLSDIITLTQTTQPLPGTLTWDIQANLLGYPNRYEALVSFSDTGNFNLNLTYDHNGCISTIQKKDLVHVRGLKADFKSDNAFHCETKHTVDLVNTSDTVSSTISGFAWRVIDAETGTVLATSTKKDFSVDITKSPSTYHVELITTSTGGCSDTTVKRNFIEIQPYAFDFFAEPTIGCVGQDFKFINNTPTASYFGLDFFSWTFYDKDKKTTLSSSAATSPTYSYSDTGYYHVELTAANPLGCQEKHLLENAVWVVDPALDYNWEDSIVCSGGELTLLSRSTPADDQFTNNYRFTHIPTGDTTNVSGDTVVTSLTEVGEYEVVYKYTVEGGCQDSLIKTLWVNGLKGKIKLDTVAGCSPLRVYPSFEAEYNIHKGFTDTTLNYYWDVMPRQGVVIQGATTANPIFSINNDGAYRIVLYVSNASGCVNYVISDQVATGIKAAFGLDRSVACVGDSILLTNRSSNTPSRLIWSVSPSVNYTIDSLDFDRRKLVIKDTGTYKISLVSDISGECLDTAYNIVEVRSLKAAFSTKDTALSCAPASLHFINQSVNADSLIWNFGDSSMLREVVSDSTLHQYLTNSDALGFDVTLVAKNTIGCTDTLTKPGYITLLGPIARFEMTNHKGCEPNVVSFSNTSENYEDYYFTYGAGLPTDTNKIVNRSYINSIDQTTQYYFPTMTVVDKNGCKATYQHTDSIAIYNYPEIGLKILPDTMVCQREVIIVQDTGKYSSERDWYLNARHQSRKNPAFVSVVNPGKNVLTLYTQNEFGCEDSASQDIYATESAKFKFGLPQFLCKNIPISVDLDVENAGFPVAFTWDMGEPGNLDNLQTTTAPQATITYTTTGPKVIRVIAEMANGCAIPDSVTIKIFDSQTIPTAQLEYVGFDSLNRIILDYQQHRFFYLEGFNVYRNGNFIGKKDSTIEGILIDNSFDINEPNCYAVSMRDQCGVDGAIGDQHCPVVLSLSSSVVQQVQLDWTYYIGWRAVQQYVIYRREKGGSFQKIDSVFNTQRSYIDSTGLCNKVFEYKVVAIRDAAISSSSNTEEITPAFSINLTPFDVQNVSVLEDQSVEIRWFTNTHEDGSHYRLWRYKNDFSNALDQIEVFDTTYIDSDVTPNEHQYLYVVTPVDRCGNTGRPGIHGKTIMLHADYKDGRSTLDWTPYEKWNFPITEHHVEFIRPGNPLHVGKVGPSNFSYVDDALYQDIDGYYPFRVYAVNSNLDTSYSNIARVSGEAVLVIPNSFSPNGDGVNETFNFFTLFVVKGSQQTEDDYEIEVYDRWGGIVYQSTDINTPWNGTSQGEDLPTGVYMYRITFTEGTGRRIYSSGTVHLIR